MNNFPIKLGGKEYWISRSIAVRLFLINKQLDKIYIILKDDVATIGKSYLKYDETLQNACGRIISEDYCCFLLQSDLNFNQFKIEDDFLGNQDVIINYYAIVTKSHNIIFTNVINIPFNEISNYKWKDNEESIIKTDLLPIILSLVPTVHDAPPF